MTTRRVLRALLPVLAPVWLMTTALSCWLRFEVVAPDALGHHVRASIRSPEVRDELARRIARAVASEDPRAAAAEPLVRSAAALVIESRQFADAMDIAAQLMRRTVLEGRADDASRLADLETQLRSTIDRLDPDLAQRIPTGWDTRIVDLRPSAPLSRVVRYASGLARAWFALLAITTIWHVAWIATAQRRRVALGLMGATTALSGVAMLVFAHVARTLTSAAVDGAGAQRAVQAAFDVTTRGWHSISLAVVLSGTVVTAATTSGTALVPAAGKLLSTAGRLLRAPRGAAARIVWSVLAGAFGVGAVVVAPRLGPAVLTMAGVALAFAAVTVLGRALPDAANPTARYPMRFRLACCAGAVLIAPLVLFGISRRSTVAGDAELRCNGWSELCDRRLDEVAFAATHNSMASADAGFLYAPQTGSISEQLDGGIRALLVDTHCGIPTGTGFVWTQLPDADREALSDGLGEETVADALHLRSSVLPPAGSPAVYLCHHYCELGATPAVDAFRAVRSFLEQNPAEVVVLFVQDETDADDTVQAMQAAGLDRFAFTHTPHEPWPTVGELIRDATQLVVFAENHGGEPAWFHRAFDLVTDNPYVSRRVDELSCDPNRGPTDAELLLVNAWVNSDLPSTALAREVNDRRHLVELAETCRERRDHVVNFVAVNFWREGDLLGAIDELNRVAGP